MRNRMQGALWARIGLIAVVVVAVSSMAHAKDKREMVVMTQNLYLGADLNPAIDADPGFPFLLAVAEIYGTVLSTDFPARADAIVEQIADHEPDIIGLQEVSRWTTTGSAPPGPDFLEILETKLAAAGLSYSVAATSNNANLGPIPLFFPPFGCVNPLGPDCTVSLLDRDVILVKKDNPDLEVLNSQHGNYEAQNRVNAGGQEVDFNRGWASVDGTFEGKKFRFVNTHLEVGSSAAVQEAQGQEFLAGPAKAGGAVIAVGDFNSRADGGSTTTYADLTKSYFDDAWSSDDPGDTCCQNEKLTNLPSGLKSAIDFVFTHAPVMALSAQVIGDTPFQMVPPLWPSDHAGVVATVRIH